MSYIDQITVGSTTYDIQDSTVPSWARESAAPVISVNGQTGEVTLTASDVGALPSSTSVDTRNIWYGTCSTASTTAYKNVTLTTVGAQTTFGIYNGTMLRVTFTYANYVNSPYLTINGKSYPIFPSTYIPQWQDAETVDFVFSATTLQWKMVDSGLASINGEYGKTKLSNSVTSTATNLAATPSAVKKAYDLAATKITAPSSPSSGQVLKYDGTAWAASTIYDIPSGGSTGQVLAKSSDDDYSVAWTDQTGGGSITTEPATPSASPSSFILSVADGGTGATTASAARLNLEAISADDVATGSGSSFVLAVSEGGTGATTASAARVNLGIIKDLLWTNPSPAANFGAQTIAGDFSGYDYYIIHFSLTAGVNNAFNICKQDIKTALTGIAPSGNTFSRYITISSTGITFENGSCNGTANAQYTIPIEIVGIKF